MRVVSIENQSRIYCIFLLYIKIRSNALFRLSVRFPLLIYPFFNIFIQYFLFFYYYCCLPYCLFPFPRLLLSFLLSFLLEQAVIKRLKSKYFLCFYFPFLIFFSLFLYFLLLGNIFQNIYYNEPICALGCLLFERIKNGISQRNFCYKKQKKKNSEEYSTFMYNFQLNCSRVGLTFALISTLII